MRRGIGALVLAAALAVLAPGPAGAQSDPAALIRAAIEDQVDAISTGDAGRAFGHATPDIQARFGSSAVFMTMVERGYPALIRPAEFRIDDIRTDGDAGAARATVVANDGRVYQAVYPLKRQPDGEWRIDGCYMALAGSRAS